MQKKSVTFDIEKELLDKIDEEAKKLDRSRASIIRLALKELLEDLQDYNLAEEGYKRYLKDGKKGVSIEELKIFNSKK